MTGDSDLTRHARSWGDRPALLTQGQPVPKRMWAYWHDPQTPAFVAACIASWRRFAPDYEVRLLNRQTVEQYTGPVPFKIGNRAPEAFSDWVRLRLLRDHGGIWMDASTLLLQPFASLVPADLLSGPDPFTFYNRLWSTRLDQPMVENWFIATPPGHPLLTAWEREYRWACLSRKGYIRLKTAIHGRDRLFQNYPPDKYFTAFVALQVVLARHKGLRVLTCDSERGPFQLHSLLDYDNARIANALVDGTAPLVGWVKISSGLRKAIIERIDQTGVGPASCLRGLLAGGPTS